MYGEPDNKKRRKNKRINSINQRLLKFIQYHTLLDFRRNISIKELCTKLQQTLDFEEGDIIYVLNYNGQEWLYNQIDNLDDDDSRVYEHDIDIDSEIIIMQKNDDLIQMYCAERNNQFKVRINIKNYQEYFGKSLKLYTNDITIFQLRELVQNLIGIHKNHAFYNTGALTELWSNKLITNDDILVSKLMLVLKYPCTLFLYFVYPCT